MVEGQVRAGLAAGAGVHRWGVQAHARGHTGDRRTCFIVATVSLLSVSSLWLVLV